MRGREERDVDEQGRFYRVDFDEQGRFYRVDFDEAGKRKEGKWPVDPKPSPEDCLPICLDQVEFCTQGDNSYHEMPDFVVALPAPPKDTVLQ